jgi:hypothetical protein
MIGEVSTGKPEANGSSCPRSMNEQAESEQLQNFHHRLSQWVSGQGFWFQLRYSLTGGAGTGALAFHVARLMARFFLFLLLLAVAGVVYLIKQTGSVSYNQEMQATFLKKLGGEELQMQGLVVDRGQFSISRLAMTGTESTFFTELEMRNLKCKRGIFSGLRKDWDPGVVTVSRADLSLRAGSDSPEDAEAMGDVYFQDMGGMKLQTIVVKDMSIRWGYSERTRGSIIGSTMTADRLPEGWKLRLKGGTFSQNWLKRLEIEDLVVQFDRNGLSIEKAIFRKNDGSVTFHGLKVKAGERPEISGKMRLRKVDMSSLLPVAVRNFVEGSISAEFNVFGSTNSSEGVGFEGDLILEDEDFITIRDRIHILRAISVVDAFNNYRRIDFNEGGFSMKTHAGKLEISNLNLSAGELFRMKGSLIARPSTIEEIQSSIDTLSRAEDESGILSDEELDNSMPLTLESAAKEAEEAKGQGFAKQGDESLFDKIGIKMESRRLEAISAERLSRALRYEGNFECSLPKEAFDKAPKLSEMYPLRDEKGRILMRVPLEGLIYDLTLDQSDGIYKNGAR